MVGLAAVVVAAHMPRTKTAPGAVLAAVAVAAAAAVGMRNSARWSALECSVAAADRRCQVTLQDRGLALEIAGLRTVGFAETAAWRLGVSEVLARQGK